MYNYYLNLLYDKEAYDILNKYFMCPSLNRLKGVSYFCGMDYASKDIYNFKETITRFDHSLTTALLSYKFSKDKKILIASLFHDVATPCFSHVIDYMNKDYLTQESTEEFTKDIILSDKILIGNIEADKIALDDIINFKKFTIVDNDRPKLCADRLDGLILTSALWTKSLTTLDIKNIIEDLKIYNNEFNEIEIGFKTEEIARHVMDLAKEIDIYCHSKEDNYMMELLASITRYALSKDYIKYNDLYQLREIKLFNILKRIEDDYLKENLFLFENIKKEEVKTIELPNVKKRDLNVLCKGKRLV